MKIFYESIDGYTEAKEFTDIIKAKEYAKECVGSYYNIGFFYAISNDGVGKITCEGITLKELLK